MLAFLTILMLIILLLVQVLFMVKASKLEKQHFKHRVVMALKEARDEIAREATKCNIMHDYVCGHHCAFEDRKVNFNKVDSIIKSKLEMHQVALDYTFEFLNDTMASKPISLTCYQQSLNGLLTENGIRLEIQFPDTSKFIFAQMGFLFYTSVFAILVLLLSFILTYKMYKKEKTLVESTSFFIDNMIHEFHTPIANIKLASNLMKKNIEVPEKLDKYLALIENEGKKMECHVMDIQTVTNLNSPGFTPVHFNDLLRECVSNFQVNANDKDGVIQFNLDAHRDEVQGDVRLIKLVISNLLDNAIKYCEEKPIVQVATYNDRKFLICKIVDNGIGIPQKYQRLIFEKYFRVDTGNVHNVKGFGLGLSFVKEVVEQHGASIEVENNQKSGVSFIIKWPLKT